jgi:hypothetical protein
MTDTITFGKQQEYLKQTSRLQVNLRSWEEGDILHFYQDLQVMFAELMGDSIALSNKDRRIIKNAYISFEKIFNTKKD